MDNGLITLVTGLLFALLLIAPGYPLLRTFFKNIPITFASFIPFSFSTSFILYFPVILILYIIKGSLIVLPIFGIFVLFTLLLYIFITKKTHLLVIPRPISNTQLLLLLFAVIISILISNQILANMDGDSLYHLGFINKIVSSGVIAPQDAFFKTDAIPSTYGYNAWYPQVAALVSLTFYSAEMLWRILSSILVIIVILSAASLSEYVFSDQKFSWIGALAFIGFQSFYSGFFELQLLSYPDQIARTILLPILLITLLDYIKSNNKKTALFIILLVSSIAFTHLFSLLVFAIILVGLFILQLIKKNWQNVKKIFIISIISLITALILLFLKLSAISSFVTNSAPITTLRSDGIWITDSLYIISPTAHFDILRWIILGLFLFIIIVSLLLKFKRSSSIKIDTILVMILSPFIILLVPIFATYGSKIFTYTYIHRLWMIIPFYLIISGIIFYLIEIFKLYRSYIKNTTFQNVLYFCIIAIPLLIPLVMPSYYAKANNNIVNENKIEEYFNGDTRETPKMLSFIKDTLPERSVIISDAWTSYRIAAFTNNFVVTSLRQHFSPVIDKNERIPQIEFMLSSQNMEEIINYIDTLDVQYWVVNKPYSEYKSYNTLTNKLDMFPVLFEKIYISVNYDIYKISISDTNISTLIEGLYQEAIENYNNGQIEYALEKLFTIISLEHDNTSALELHEEIRRLADSTPDNFLNVAQYAAGASINEFSPFFSFPNNLDAILDNKINSPNDYSAAINDTLPNWFIIDFQIPRLINSYSITWYSKKESGSSWKLYGLVNNSWLIIDSVIDSAPSPLYSKDFESTMIIKKIKLEVESTNGQNRTLIKAIDVR